MRQTFTFFLILTLSAIACQSVTGTSAPATPTPASVSDSTSTPQAVSAPEATVTPTALPKDVIFVDTLDQEIYPFIENGKCSLGEAIFAANSGEPKDSCAAGVPDQSVIELMPGEYHFTQRDQTPSQGAWAYSTVDIGDGLPVIIRALTIHGNGAILIRDEAAEPFRFFEVLSGVFTLKDITLQGGDVQNDWGGAIFSRNASIVMEGVRLENNRAENGGGLYFDLGALTIQTSKFVGNHASQSGGALFIDSAKTNIHDSHFEENNSDGDGGALYAETVTLVITNNIFLKNRVTGENNGTVGGAIFAEHVNLTITESQFYQNESPMYGGAVAASDPILAGTDPEDGNPIDQIQQSPYVSGMLTSIPGFQATLEAHPSGVFVDFHEDIQIHNNCFANNITINPEDPNWTSGLLGRAAAADGNYWGDPSGPSGKGPGRGDSVGKNVIFAPFLKEMPAYCDSSLAQKQ